MLWLASTMTAEEGEPRGACAAEQAENSLQTGSPQRATGYIMFSPSSENKPDSSDAPSKGSCLLMSVFSCLPSVLKTCDRKSSLQKTSPILACFFYLMSCGTLSSLNGWA